MARPLRVAYVTDQFISGHSFDKASTRADAIQIVSMAAAFGEAGVDLTMVMPAYPKRPIPTAPQIAAQYGVEPSFEVLPLPGPYPAPLKFRGMEKVAHALFAAQRSHRRNFDVVYSRNLPVVLGALSGTLLPVVYETHRPWPEIDPTKKLLFKALRGHPRFKGLVLHSQLALKSYLDLGYRNDQVCVALNGVDARPFAEPLSIAEARRRLGLPSDQTLVVYAGQIAPEKGLGHLLEAAQRMPEARFALVGSADDGPIEARARALPNVQVVPWLPPHHVGTWLMAADILAIPPVDGRTDTLAAPTKTFQYLAAGRAIVAPDLPEVRELLSDDVHARLVRPGDVVRFVEVLRELAADAPARVRLGAAARERIAGRTWEERALHIVDFLAQHRS